ncbi:argonaute-like protein [Infundibulicybe gibba]|nr:argonaute-like protein [Infundibulicybe gibba]
MSSNRGQGPRGRGGRGSSPATSDAGRGSPAPGRGSGFRGRGGPPQHQGYGGGGGPPRGRGGGGPRGGRGGFGGSVIYAEGAPAPLPERLSDGSHQQLITTYKSLKAKPDRPLRPGYGTIGTPITLRANFFPVKVPKGPIYDYIVEISPTQNINALKIRIFQLLELSPQFKPHLGYIAHDRSQRIVSARKLPQPLDIPVPFYDDHQQGPGPNPTVYTVSIRHDRELDMGRLNDYLDGRPDSQGYDPLPLISALNLVLQQHPSSTGVRVGKNKYFFPPVSSMSLGFGIEAWQGFYTSVRPTYKQLMVNVNVCMSAFVTPGNLADALFAFNQNSKGAMPTLPKSLAKSMKIKTQHLGHTKRVFAIGSTSARNTVFECEEFRNPYNITLKHPVDLPVVDIGTAKRSVYIPAELCQILPGSVYRAKLSDTETAAMIKLACNPPRMNAEAVVREGFPSLGLSPVKPPVNGFGLTIDLEMAVVPAREIPPPRLSYSSGQANVRNAGWNILDVKFQRGATISSWWVLVVRDSRNMIAGPTDPALATLVENFTRKCGKSGMAIPNTRPRLLVVSLPPPSRDPGRATAIDQIRTVIRENLGKVPKKPDFILVLLENRDNFIYPGIKRLGDVEIGVQTIHMQLSKALTDPNKQDQYLSNVALKVNTKLGGMNHLLDAAAMRWLVKKKTMMVGIDVTHPGPGSREGTPSIAAVVANVDDTFVQFPASLRVQESKKEMLDELTEMLVERLLVYESKNKMLPERIFVFRDGVSEGQFDTVLEEELRQILSAFKKLATKERKNIYRPKLTIVICGFFATNSQFADKNGNTRPGTVVDKGVTGVFDFDFYLQAHAGLQGTVKSTHYTVVYDENALTADEIQQGTHDTSYLYARATKAVSLIPAAYYADLACERGRCYLNEFLVDDRTSSGGRGGRDKEEEKKRVFAAAKQAWGQGLHPDMRDKMFYI